MKIVVVFFTVLFSSVAANAQDTIKPIVNNKRIINHEIGANTTTLLKQVLNFSNSTIPTLPYDITYKLIYKSFAFRAGAGMTSTDTEASSTIVTTNSSVVSPGQTPPAPDPTVPTMNESSSFSYRFGAEYRERFERLVVSAGMDFIGQSINSYSQSSSVFNNLPNSYQFSSTSQTASTKMFGFGPVFGLQFFLSKRLSIYTEMPIYFQYSTLNDFTNSYSNSAFNQGQGTLTYTTVTSQRTNVLKEDKMSITLPVTLYLVVKF